jgi:hypothetical protein
MLSGVSRRRKALVVAALMAGSVLGAGVPVLVLPGSHDSAGAAVATITLRVDGDIPGVSGSLDVTFAKLGGITYDVTLPQPSTSSTSKAIANPVPPVITLSEPFATGIATYEDMIAWERAVREGNPAGREDATLTLTAATGTTIAQYDLINAFPTNVDVAAGDPQSTSFTVQLTADDFLLASSSG